MTRAWAMVGHSPGPGLWDGAAGYGLEEWGEGLPSFYDGREEFGQAGKAMENDLVLMEPGGLLNGPSRPQPLCPADQVEPRRQ